MSALTTKVDWAVTDVPFQKGQEAYIEFGKGCALLNSQGVTQQEIADRYEMSQAAINYAITVGKDQRVISAAYKVSLKSQYNLYLLTTLDDADFEYVVEKFGSEATRDTILAVKAGYDTVEEWKFAKAWDEAHSINKTFDKLRMIEDWAAAIAEDLLRFPPPEPEPEPTAQIVHAPKALPEDILVAEFLELLKGRKPVAIKAIRAMFSSLYHSDSGKLEKNDSKLGVINAALTKLEK